MEPVFALGISGSSDRSGVKASFIRTDGNVLLEKISSDFFPYPVGFFDRITAARSEFLRLYNTYDLCDRQSLIRRIAFSSPKKKFIHTLSEDITRWMTSSAKSFISKNKIKPSIVGFRGQEIFSSKARESKKAMVYDLGDHAFFADSIGISVVKDFCVDNIEKGGNGSSLIPIYYKVLFQSEINKNGYSIIDKLKIAIVQIDDISNVTIIEPGKVPLAFDAGPGGGLIDEFVQRSFQKENDKNGLLAMKGEIFENLIIKWLGKEVLSKKAPNVLENVDFWDCLDDFIFPLTPLDFIATLTGFVARAIRHSINLNGKVDAIILLGEYAENNFLKSLLSRFFKIINPKSINWDSYFIESEQYAYYAVRSVMAFPISFPSTTGVSEPVSCGTLTVPKQKYAA